jgi:hypothetical protein
LAKDADVAEPLWLKLTISVVGGTQQGVASTWCLGAGGRGRGVWIESYASRLTIVRIRDRDTIRQLCGRVEGLLVPKDA